MKFFDEKRIVEFDDYEKTHNKTIRSIKFSSLSKPLTITTSRKIPFKWVKKLFSKLPPGEYKLLLTQMYGSEIGIRYVCQGGRRYGKTFITKKCLTDEFIKKAFHG